MGVPHTRNCGSCTSVAKPKSATFRDSKPLGLFTTCRRKKNYIHYSTNFYLSKTRRILSFYSSKIHRNATMSQPLFCDAKAPMGKTNHPPSRIFTPPHGLDRIGKHMDKPCISRHFFYFRDPSNFETGKCYCMNTPRIPARAL